MPIQTNIKIRRGTDTSWSQENPVLDEGELGWDKTNNKIKIGDGIAEWSSLNSVNPNFYSYKTTIGNGFQTSFTINHNLNASGDVFVNVRNSTGQFTYPDTKYIDEDNLLLEFQSPPSINQYIVIITGICL